MGLLKLGGVQICGKSFKNYTSVEGKKIAYTRILCSPSQECVDYNEKCQHMIQVARTLSLPVHISMHMFTDGAAASTPKAHEGPE